MQSPCNLHLAGRAVAAQNQDRIPQVNGNRGRQLMMPALWLSESIMLDARRRIKATMPISSGENVHLL